MARSGFRTASPSTRQFRTSRKRHLELKYADAVDYSDDSIFFAGGCEAWCTAWSEWDCRGGCGTAEQLEASVDRLPERLDELINRVPLFPCRIQQWKPGTSEGQAACRLEEKLKELQQVRTVTDWSDLCANHGVDPDAAVAQYRLAVDEAGPGSHHWRTLLLRLAAFWVRSPQTWDKNESSLWNHLFRVHDVPTCLDRPPQESSKLPLTEWAMWFITLSQGGSSKRLSREFGWPCHGKFQQALFDADPTLDTLNAFLWAYIRARGGTKRIFAMFQAEVGSANILKPESQEDREAVDWVIRHQEELTADQVATILNWVRHERFEMARVGLRFLWKGRTVPATLRRATEYTEAISRVRRADLNRLARLKWQVRGWSATIERAESVWEFVELTNGAELFEEGKALRHCVGSYVHRCISDDSVIVSLRRDGKRAVTIEVHPPTRRVVQAHGQGNRGTTPVERAVIDQWRQSTLATQE